MLDWERFITNNVLASVLGAFITAVKFSPGASFAERASNAVTGAAGAIYATPAMVEWLNIKSQAYQSGLAFTLGLFSMSLMAALTQAIKDTQWGQVLTSWLQKRIGG